MTPHKEPHEEHKRPHDHAAGRAFNTPEHATTAVATGRACISALVPGRVWSQRGPRGEFEIKGCLILNDRPVTALHFNPEDGSLLPKGLHGLSAATEQALAKAETSLKTISQELTVLDGAEFREPECCWAIPLAHKGRIVGHIKVSADGMDVVADRKTVDDLARLDQHQ